MADHRLIPNDRQEFLLSILAGEILTRRGDLGPLARVIQPVPQRRRREGEKTIPRKDGGRAGK